jgi:hypothetical protein
MKEIQILSYHISEDPGLTVPDVLVLSLWLTIATFVLRVGK